MFAGMKTPAVFLSHGAQTIALEGGDYARDLERFGRQIEAPRGLVVFSGHFQEPGPIRITAAPRPGLIYDFGGFPDELYRLTYPAPGSPPLASRIGDLLNRAGFASVLDGRRGWDHGLWVPLRLAFPRAEVPVVEVSLPRGAPPAELMRIGAALAPLRNEGVVLIGSGGIVHNLRKVRPAASGDDVDAWAKEFDRWVADRVEKIEVPELLSYKTLAPHENLAVPTTEHFDPLFVVLGSREEGDRVVTLHEGFQYGNISLRSLALGETGVGKRETGNGKR
jgi:4,5-DOPA dioxygenase extradiol